ncbi:MAG: hypothetical protein J4428_04680 [Candidatus Aenigmarchaeota archaeon]|nr:hypothetical protein [Candidatus Aenigmarchaeota archaeon]
MQWKTFYVQNLDSTTQIIGYDSRMALAKVKNMGLEGPFVIREKGIVLLIEINGKIIEKEKLTEKMLLDSFPDQTKEWLRRTFESFNH